MITENTTQKHCNTCDNNGKINGLSQETYCEQCIFQSTRRQDNYKPKPVKQKVDWSKLSRDLAHVWNPSMLSVENGTAFPSPWIAWNCDEHTRGNPLPGGLIVERVQLCGSLPSTFPSNQVYWNNVRCFRIVGIQEGWE